MIKYSREEFPLRFKVFEHTCKYCGVTFYSNRSTSSYDTPTCRVYDWQNKKGKLEKGGTIPKPKDNAPKEPENPIFIPITSKWNDDAEKEFCKYFPEAKPGIVSDFPYNFADVWEGYTLKGENDKYFFVSVYRTEKIKTQYGLVPTDKKERIGVEIRPKEQ